jgi:spore germination cell wall hydrolase CwlJ-like protein
MGRSRIGWAASVVAPWCLAVGVLLSITAEAEQETIQLSGVYDRNRLLEESDPVRKAIALASRRQAVDADGTPLPLVETRLFVGDPGDNPSLDEIEPKATLKPPAEPFPDVDESAKGGPFIGMRPGFDARGRSGPGDALPDSLQGWPQEIEGPRDAEFDPSHTMSPVRPGDPERPPAVAASTFSDGATPALPLEFALNSSSPTSSDGVVVAVVTDPNSPETTVAQQSLLGGGQPNYAALIDPKDSARQMRCLAEAIYFESRSEPEAGQAAVAQVVLNRVRSGIYPSTVCGVVYQDRNRPFACQFSFACEGKSLRIGEPGPWAVATRIAEEVVSGKNYNPAVAAAVNYHANYVSPFWVGYLRRVDRIGAHIFYAMRDGVNWAPGALNGHGDRP